MLIVHTIAEELHFSGDWLYVLFANVCTSDLQCNLSLYTCSWPLFNFHSLSYLVSAMSTARSIGQCWHRIRECEECVRLSYMVRHQCLMYCRDWVNVYHVIRSHVTATMCVYHSLQLLRSDQVFVSTWGFLEWCRFLAFCSCHLQCRCVVRGCSEWCRE